MVEEFLEMMPAEKCWAITAKTLWRFTILRGDKIIAAILGRGEGIIAPVMGAEKWKEINDKIYSDGGKQMFPHVKETFNIPVEDAVGAAKLVIVAVTLLAGPECKFKIIEATQERASIRVTKCPTVWEIYEELEVDPEHRACDPACQTFREDGLKAISPNISYKLAKTIPRGDFYCEDIIEFKEE
ncbi:hypothetical protein [Candidatus Borrarchaeum sp.]|uniref:hypothetical protein n=1 Tax=Candidatus Borrarchaeum sp. TaxID=2846742 RepID=UPI00257D4EB6|nr:hypothetical protein [Candidatus Borrarchaeum sp.]